jgi:hypothetical protein
MIKKILLIAPILLLTSAAMQIDSNSAPASTTGAPGEVDCTTSGCHQSFITNSGNGTVSIIPDSAIANYTPGKTYSISLEVNQANLIRFGFQMVALKDKDNSNIGAFTPTDGTRNQITTGFGNLSDRKYITYTFKSTSAQTAGKGVWSFNWTAPSTNEGPITFYAAAIAANNDGNDLGDYCYTNTLKINSNAINSTAPQISNEFNIRIFPNPIKDKINFNYSIPEASYTKIDLTDLQGKIIEELFSAQQAQGEYNFSLPLTNRYKGGIYFIRFNRSGKTTFKKVFITE